MIDSELRPLFSWIHLSDLHFGHGDARHRWDQRLVLEELLRDVPQTIARFGLPTPNALLVTGDIAFSGATRATDEYESATAFLRGVAQGASLEPSQIFVVPGNHDVQRSADKAPGIGRLVRSLREGHEQLDTILENSDEKGLLAQRQANYLRFSRQFAPGCISQEKAGALHWSHRIECDGLYVRLIGLNTAMLSADDADQGKLRLGLSGLASSLLEPALLPDELVLVLSHHPLQGGWLYDEAEIDGWLRSRAHVHLFGHIHSAETESLRRGGQGGFVRITAGAAHGERLPPGQPAGHGYSFATVFSRADGTMILRVWPRMWTDANRAFRADVRLLPDGQSFAEHILGLKLRPGTQPREKPAAAPLLAGAATTAAPATLDAHDSPASQNPSPPRASQDAARRGRLIKLLGDALAFDSDLDMLCFTYFPEVFGRFTQGMDRKQKYVLLLASAVPEQVLASLKEYSPERFYRFVHPQDKI